MRDNIIYPEWFAIQSGTLNSSQNWRYFVSCDLEIWWMSLENNRALLLYYVKLCVSFQIYRWTQTGVTVRKRSIRVKIGDILSCVTLKFAGWPWKTTGHLFYAASSFVHHFKAIGEFKLDLVSGNAQFGSTLAIFCPMWPWNLMDDLAKQVHHFTAIGEFKLELQSGNAMEP